MLVLGEQQQMAVVGLSTSGSCMADCTPEGLKMEQVIAMEVKHKHLPKVCNWSNSLH